MSINKRRNNFEEINDIKVLLRSKRLKGFKFNHSLEDFIQNFTNYSMYIFFSIDMTQMYIINRKPIDRTQYVLESDPREVDRMRREEYAEMCKIETQKLTWDFR